jgi:stearoyl-CoA desaturase (delta-9 desaturase)
LVSPRPERLAAATPAGPGPAASPPAPLAWGNIAFLATVHLGAVAGLAIYLPARGLSAAALGLGLAWMALTIFSLSAGYHRLVAHRAYEASPVLRFFLLAFGAATFQNSALVWAADHRRHHKRVDTSMDPYDARRGFWYSHIGWVLRHTPLATALQPVPDLERDPLVAWQHRYYPLIGLVTGFALPTALGAALGDGWGGFVVAGLARLVVVYHITFSINSFAHMFGRQPYSDRNSSRDSFLLALFSMGEGYHNFHHTFPADYRNGVRAHHFDPSKWAIRMFSAIGLARNLRRTPRAVVIRARLRMDARRVHTRQLPAPLRERLTSLQAGLEAKLDEWSALIARCRSATRAREDRVMKALQAELRSAREGFDRLYRDWRELLRSIELTPPIEA